MASSPALIELCSPTTMQRPLPSISPARPPGFEASPTPAIPCSGTLQRTPTSPRAHQRTSDDSLPAGLAALAAPCPAVELPELLFCMRQPALLAPSQAQPQLHTSPMSTPPRRPAARRKTLAGIKISSAGGLSLQRVRHTAVRPAAVRAAKTTERLICCSMGITRDGEDVTESTLQAFINKFKEHFLDDVIVAMREFFELDNTTVNVVEDALIGHGGDGLLDTATRPQDDGAQAALTREWLLLVCCLGNLGVPC
ncbi:hypothetical protein VPH35_001503 [Triticum aestivum]